MHVHRYLVCALTAAPFFTKKLIRKVLHLCHLVENKLHIKDQDCVIITHSVIFTTAVYYCGINYFI